MRWLDGITDSRNMSFRQTLGDSEAQGSLACCSSWGHKELDTTEQLNLIEQQNVTKFSKDIQFLHVRSIQLLQLKRLNYGYFLFENRWLKTGRNPPVKQGNMGLIPRSGSSPGEENRNPLQYSCLGNPKVREVWLATIHGVEKELDMT